MISKQISQSAEYNIMYEILRKLERITNLAPHIGWNDGGNMSTSSTTTTTTTTIDPGLLWLQQNAHFFTDLQKLGGGLTLANGNPSFEDIGPNNHNSILSGTPIRRTVLLDGKNWSALQFTSTNALNLQTNGFAFLQQSSIRLFCIMSTNDGQPTTNLIRMFGESASPGGWGIQLAGNTNGTIRIDIGNSTNGLATWTSSSAVFTNGVNSLRLIDISLNFVTDALTLLVNGISVAGTWTTSNISAINPALYDTNFNLFVGNRGTNGVVINNNTSELYLVKCAMTPISPPQSAIDHLKKLIMESYLLTPDVVTGDVVGLSGAETSIFGNPIYNNQYMYYGVTSEINPGAVRQYSLAVAQLTSPNTATKLGIILNRTTIGLVGSAEGIIPMGLYVKNGTIYIFCTVNIQAGGNATGLCTASISDPLTLTYQGLVVDDGTNGTRFNHGFCPFDNSDDPNYVYAIQSHRDNDTLPLKARIVKSLKSGDLEAWSVVYNNVIFTTDPTENLVYYNIERINGVWKLMFGSFNSTVGGFSVWQTASTNLEFFPEGNELLPPNMIDEEYTSKPLLSSDRTHLYYARRAGGASTNYIGIRVKLSQDLTIEENIY